MRNIVLLCIFSSLVFASSDIKIKIAKMHCPLCTTIVKKAIKSLDGIEKVSVRLNTKIAKVTYNENRVTANEILKAIKKTSYEGVIIK